ncbi:MAG: type II toxin-antitoxin system Phd/YefM family antitoxin [Clostridia bacterium]|nr:type II toxin-antitoxin system Phd/YefM family antitoxin [Clostridia bacterium]
MPQIIPIKELKNTLKVSELCHKNQEPVYVTKNGYGDMVLMSMEVYEEMTHRLELYQEMVLSQQQFEKGEVKDAFKALDDLRDKYDLQAISIEQR